MALNTCEMWSNGIKIAFFRKNYEKSPSCWELRPHTPVCDTFELRYTSLLKHVSQFRHFRILSFGLSPLLERIPRYVPTPGRDFWSSILRYLWPPKNSSFKVSDGVIACDLGSPQSKILTTPMRARVEVLIKVVSKAERWNGDVVGKNRESAIIIMLNTGRVL